MSRKEYHAARYQRLKAEDPEFLRKNAERSAAQRAKNTDKTKQSNAKRRAIHADRTRAEVRAWFAANPEKRRVYEQNRRAKKRERGGTLSPDIASMLMVLQGGKCACCRAKMKYFHLDHVMPLHLGGEHTDKNMQLLCPPCNQAKHAKHPVDFMQSRGYLL